MRLEDQAIDSSCQSQKTPDPAMLPFPPRLQIIKGSMSTAPKSVVAVDHRAPPAPEREPNLARFGLRQLFFFFSAATVLSAALAQVGGVWPIVIGCAVALVVAHVFGTFLGTRLRDTSAEVQHWKCRPGSPDRDEPVALPQPVRFDEIHLPATTPLASYEQLHRWCHVCIAAGSAIGFMLGGIGIYIAGGDEVTWFGLAMGAVSCGVIGAWAALLGTNFWTISRHAFRQASKEK
jgi:hypothetical protein